MERPFFTIGLNIVIVIASALTQFLPTEARFLTMERANTTQNCQPPLSIANWTTEISPTQPILQPRRVYTYSPSMLKTIGKHRVGPEFTHTTPSYESADWSHQIRMARIDRNKGRKTRRKTRGGARRKTSKVTNVSVCHSDQNNTGVRVKIENRSLPSIIMGNVRSLCNKLDELAALTKFFPYFNNASLLCFTETWFLEKMTKETTSIDGFSVHRGDRKLQIVNKDSGGGVCVYVNDKWCHKNNVHVKIEECTPDLELLVLSMRPHYLPREFSHVIVACVYVPCKANTQTSLNMLASHIYDIETSCPDSFIVISGDFNNRTLSKILPNYRQQVKCPTREGKTIDLCYSKIKDAYSSSPIAPLGRSDHNLVRLTPEYTPLVKREPPKTIQVKQWTDEAIEKLNDCFENTSWSTFVDSSDNLNELTVTICDYINFCVENCVQEKSVTIYKNDKPWLTKGIKSCIKEKSKAFKSKDRNALKAAQTKLKREIRKGKHEYREKLEEQFQKGGSKELWEGLGKMTGYRNKKKCKEDFVPRETDTLKFANDLNNFYARFDSHDFSIELSDLKSSLNQKDSNTIELDESEIRNAFKNVNSRKGAGPDGVHPKVLKYCNDALSFIFTQIFNLSLKTCTVPETWKTSCIIPVPKKTNYSEMNDLRPIAMTSAIMKTFERLMLAKLQPLVTEFVDPLQFAYRTKRGVEDALLYVLNEIYSNLEHQGSYARLMFFDFSSAFNTIQPHILGKKLTNMNLNSKLILWIIDYLCGRPQYISVANQISSTVITNTGAPQGTVLSPFLFSLYTSDCGVQRDTGEDGSSCTMVKYADDTSLCGFIRGGDETMYRDSVSKFVKWCEDNYLLLNVNKTKEMTIDFRRNTNPEVDTPIVIKGEDVERVPVYKYLGVQFDEKLTWTENTTTIVKKCQSRLFFLRKLRSFNASPIILSSFYKSILQSALTFCALCWGGNISSSDTDRLDKIINKAEKMIGGGQTSFRAYLEDRDKLKMSSILKDETHPLWPEYDSAQLKSGRFRVPRIHTQRYHDTFIPRSILEYNKNFKR